MRSFPSTLPKREHKAPEFLKINPAGKLPALVDGDSKIFEGTAICLYLGDKFPQANLAPKIGATRTGPLPVVDGLFNLSTRARDGRRIVKSGVPCPSAAGPISRLRKNVVEGELGKGPYLFGDWFTAADIMIGSMFIWKRIFGAPSGAASARGVCGSSPRPSQGDEAGQMIFA